MSHIQLYKFDVNEYSFRRDLNKLKCVGYYGGLGCDSVSLGNLFPVFCIVL